MAESFPFRSNDRPIGGSLDGLDIFENFIRLLEGKGLNVVRRGGQDGQAMAQCPAHDDKTASLAVAVGDDGLLVHCFANCPIDQIVRALGWEVRDLFPKRQDGGGRARVVAQYVYLNAEGKPLYRKTRTADKRFFQSRFDPGRNTWIAELEGVTKTLYQEPFVRAVAGRHGHVWICEGEKDADRLNQAFFVAGELNQVATTAGGVNDWSDHLCPLLAGAGMVLVAYDNDDAGRKAWPRVVASLLANSEDWAGGDATVARSKISIIELAEGCKDLYDHLEKNPAWDSVTCYDPPADLLPAQAPVIVDGGEVSRVIGWLDLASEEIQPYRWVVPGLIEREDTVLITGWEGGGKSTLVRHLAVCAAVGFHPFDTSHKWRYKPARVLLVDAENSRNMLRRKFRELQGLAAGLKGEPDNEHLKILSCPMGIDLLREEWVSWLDSVVMDLAPDMLCIGPLYQIHDGDPNKEEVAKAVTKVLREVREKVNCAVIIEAHSPHGKVGAREGRPAGSSAWGRWAQFGFAIETVQADQTQVEGAAPSGSSATLQHWRGMREFRDWPKHVAHGTDGRMQWVSPLNHDRHFGYDAETCDWDRMLDTWKPIEPR